MFFSRACIASLDTPSFGAASSGIGLDSATAFNCATNVGIFFTIASKALGDTPLTPDTGRAVKFGVGVAVGEDVEAAEIAETAETALAIKASLAAAKVGAEFAESEFGIVAETAGTTVDAEVAVDSKFGLALGEAAAVIGTAGAALDGACGLSASARLGIFLHNADSASRDTCGRVIGMPTFPA